jgi:hypothetical protein
MPVLLWEDKGNECMNVCIYVCKYGMCNSTMGIIHRADLGM